MAGDRYQVSVEVEALRLQSFACFSGVPRRRLESLVIDSTRCSLTVGDRYSEPRPVAVLVGGLLVRDGAGETVDVVADGEFWAPAPGETGEAIAKSELLVLPPESTALAWAGAADMLVRERELDTPLAGPVETVMRPVVAVAAETRASEAAFMMTEGASTAILVEFPDSLGIVTDHDLRAKLVARGSSPDIPIGEIASSPVRTVSPGAPLAEAAAVMIDGGFHHLPVVEGGRPVGMLEGLRLLTAVERSPMRLRRMIPDAESVDELAGVWRRLPVAAEDLLASGMGALGVLRMLTSFSDAVMVRVAELDPPPGDRFAWVSVGSQGRTEQGLLTDQDHALVVAEEEAVGVFGDWAARLIDSLEQVGYPRCPGGTMASESTWRHTPAGWRTWTGERLSDAKPRAVLEAASAMDARIVAGDPELMAPFPELRRLAAASAPFMARLAGVAAHFRVPLGFLGRITVDRMGEGAGTFDIKEGAVGPIAVTARVYGLACGSDALDTVGRVADAEAAGRVSGALGEMLRQGYEVASRIRLEHHLDQWRRSDVLDNRVDPDRLSSWERRLLKEVFRAVREAQTSLESDYQTGYVR